MNSAPAELLHPLTYAALQPLLITSFSLQRFRCNQKKRWQQRQRRNSISEKSLPFLRKKPPYPIESGKAAQTD
jgi:hypothetical protein